MNERHIKNGTSTKTDWDRFHSMTDEEIEQAAKSDPDAQPTGAEFWTDAQSVFPVEDQEVVTRSKESYGEGYQEKMTAVLREFMESNTTS